MGAGAIGSLFGGYLAKSGEDVTLIGRSPLMKAINQKGLKIDSIKGEEIIKVKTATSLINLNIFDLIILTVKAYDVEQTINDISHSIGTNTKILCLQNGLGILEIVSKIINPEQIIMGTTTNGALFVEPGHIRHTGQGETIIGMINGQDYGILQAIKKSLDKSGLETSISETINEVLWMKLLINISINPFGALTRLPNGKLRKIFENSIKQVIKEAIDIAKKMDFELDLNKVIDKTFNVLERTSKNRNSMLQDIEHKKRTEIEFINGIIVKYGKIYGVPTPLNSLLTSLIKGLEQSYLK